jgi:hypothetical protein
VKLWYCFRVSIYRGLSVLLCGDKFHFCCGTAVSSIDGRLRPVAYRGRGVTKLSWIHSSVENTSKTTLSKYRFHSLANWVEPLTRALTPPDTHTLCPLSSTEFVDHPAYPHEKNSWVRHWYRRCYAVGCTTWHREGRGKLYRFPRNPRDYPETPNMAISPHALKRCKFRCDRSKMKGTLAEEQRTILGLSAFLFKRFSWKFPPSSLWACLMNAVKSGCGHQ